MITPSEAAIWFLPFVLPIAIWAAWFDLKYMKIPNKAVIALVGVFLIVGLFLVFALSALTLEDWAWRWLHLVVVLVVTFILSSVGMMGAGDAKYLSAIAPFIAMQDAGSFMIILAIVALLALILHRLVGRIPLVRRKAGHWESWSRQRVFPYGLALSTSFIIYLIIAIRT
jgi:prepilin peptidase CpaA